jgi:AhpD family alkylhydroperoxidase
MTIEDRRIMMSNRTNPYTVPGNPMQLLFDYGAVVRQMGLEPSLVALVQIRASQLNGCAPCLLWHTREARKAGETEARIYLLEAWRESPLYSPRERAAIAWTDALTRMDRRDADEAYDLVASEFTLEEQVQLNLLIGMINSVNRINAGFAVVPPAAAEDRRAA